MRHLGLALLILPVAVAACAPRNDGHEPGSQRPAQVPPQAAPPPGASGKIAAEQVGQVSPVPAFQGGGGDWRIAIQATGGMRHSVQLRWGGTAHAAAGTARYLPAEATPGMHRLDGTLYGDNGDRAMHLTLQRGDCTGATGRVHPYAVVVTIDGMAPLRGCGELALP